MTDDTANKASPQFAVSKAPGHEALDRVLEHFGVECAKRMRAELDLAGTRRQLGFFTERTRSAEAEAAAAREQLATVTLLHDRWNQRAQAMQMEITRLVQVIGWLTSDKAPERPKLKADVIKRAMTEAHLAREHFLGHWSPTTGGAS